MFLFAASHKNGPEFVLDFELPINIGAWLLSFSVVLRFTYVAVTLFHCIGNTAGQYYLKWDLFYKY